MRDIICLALASKISGTRTLEARVGAAGALPTNQAGAHQKPTPKERMLQVPTGSVIEVKLPNKEKIRGRPGELADEGFSLTTAQGDKIATRKISFSELKSFKRAGGGKTGYALLSALAGIGALFVVLVIWAATRSD